MSTYKDIKLQRYKVTYFSPYADMGFECDAVSVGEARHMRDAYHESLHYMIEYRYIKSERFGGKKV